jgi:hypothetical protein
VNCVCVTEDWSWLIEWFAEDGKEMLLDLEKMKIKEIQVEVDRHSRILRRQEELAG